jgi:hypothetical protein
MKKNLPDSSSRTPWRAGGHVRLILEWLLEQRSSVAIGLAVVLFAVTLILRYGFDPW